MTRGILPPLPDLSPDEMAAASAALEAAWAVVLDYARATDAELIDPEAALRDATADSALAAERIFQAQLGEDGWRRIAAMWTARFAMKLLADHGIPEYWGSDMQQEPVTKSQEKNENPRKTKVLLH